MSLTKEQISELKNQLKEQVKNVPEDKKKQALDQIDSLSEEALEQLINEQKERNQKTIFRMIVEGEVDSVKVGENQDSLAVLDINPISKGHIMVIPKKAVKDQKDIPKSCFDLAKELTEKITSHLKAKSVKVEPNSAFGEAIINIIPIYDLDLNKDSKRTKAELSELNDVKKVLETIKIEKKIEEIKIERKTTPQSQVVKLNRRIP